MDATSAEAAEGGRVSGLEDDPAESGERGRNVPEGGRYEDISQGALEILEEKGVKGALEKAAKEQLEEAGLWDDLKRGELKSSGETLTVGEVESRLAGEYAGKEFFQSERGIQRLTKQDPELAVEIENAFLEMAERTQDPGQRTELLKTAGKYDRAMGEVSGKLGTEYSTESGRAGEDLRQEKGELELLPEEGTSLGEKTTNASTDDVKNIDNLKPVEYFRDEESPESGRGEKGNSPREIKPENITRELLKTKPKGSPSPRKWLENSGKIAIDSDGFWIYTNRDGVRVKYTNHYPDFLTAGEVGQRVDIDEFRSRGADSRKADKLAPNGPKKEGSVWHHSEDGRHMEEIPENIHREFTHYGGFYVMKQRRKQK